MDNKIVLEYPVKDAGVEIKQVTMRRAKVADLRAASKSSDGNVDYEMTLFGNLCGLSPAAMDELDAVDYVQMQKVYSSFLVKTSATNPPGSSAQ